MKRTLQNIILGAVLVLGGCERLKELENQTPQPITIVEKLPEWQAPERQGNYLFNPNNILENQKIRYLHDINTASYELLTDLDHDKKPDVLERKACGFDGQAQYRCQHALYVKNGHRISNEITREPIRGRKENDISPKTEINYVDDQFFKAYSET